MDRVAVFVDAGYVFAQGSVLLAGKKLPRGGITLDHAAATAAFARFAEKVSGVRLLRVYWYDGTSTGPTAQHLGSGQRRLGGSLARSTMAAMATATKTTYPHIVKVADYCGGKAAIDQTRVRVADVVAAHQRGLLPTQILESYPHLTLGQVHAALAYYYDNREEIDEIFASEDADEARGLPEQIVRVP